MAKIRPLGDRVVVKPDPKEETTRSGIIIPDTAKEKPQQHRMERRHTMAVNTHPDCEPIQQTVQSLTQQIEEIDFRISALEAEALELNPLPYLVSQRKVDRLIRVKRALQDEWHNAMNELAICRSAHPAHRDFGREHVSLEP